LSWVRWESSVSVGLAAGLGDGFQQADRAVDRLDAVTAGAVRRRRAQGPAGVDFYCPRLADSLVVHVIPR